MDYMEALKSDPLLSTAVVASILGLKPYQLAMWRSQGVGLPWIKIGEGRTGAVRYRASDVHAFIASRRRQVKRLTHLGAGKPTDRVRKAARAPASFTAPAGPSKP